MITKDQARESKAPALERLSDLGFTVVGMAITVPAGSEDWAIMASVREPIQMRKEIRNLKVNGVKVLFTRSPAL